MNKREKNVLVILGMHRSGTSALSGMMRLLGVDLGQDLMKPSEFNLKGYFENNKITLFNERILHNFGYNWDTFFLLPEGWEFERSLKQIKDEIKAFLLTEFKNGHLIGIKDPRLCLLMPFWDSILEEMDYRVKYIISLRSPMEIQKSLAKQYNFSKNKSLNIWMNNMLSLERFTRKKVRTFIHFETLLKEPFDSIKRMDEQLRVGFSHYSDNISQNIIDFLDPNLKHHNLENVTKFSDEPKFVSELYFLLAALLHDPQNLEIYERIDKIDKQYRQFSKFFYNQEVIEKYNK